jgi:hypothetical protein
VTEPDFLASEARRWVCGSTVATDPRLIAAVLNALGRYYSDLTVVAGIVKWRRDHLCASPRGNERRSS